MTNIMQKILLIIILVTSVQKINAQDFEKIANEIMVKNTIPAMAFAVITEDSITIKKVLGHHKITEINEKSNVTIDDYFHLGSLTKAITGFIAGYLVDRDKTF